MFFCERMKYMKFFSYIKKHNVLFSVGFFVLLIVTSFSIKSIPSKGALGFGGEIMDVMVCDCSENIAIVVGTPTPGVYMYEPTTILYEYYNLFTSGSWVLGTYTPGGVCLEISGPDCTPLANPTGTIDMAGTSM